MEFIKPSLGEVVRAFEPGSHFGIDIAMPGNIGIRAAASGVVSKSFYSNTYGEVMFIVHHIHGQLYETVYAHLRPHSRKYAQGDYVKQGQIIGYMGQTGDIIYQHVHFELHKGLWNEEMTHAVNPCRYLNQAIEEQAKELLLFPEVAQAVFVYPLTENLEPGKEKGFLTPEKIGGLHYEILGNPMPHVYTIETSAFGKVNVYIEPSTGVQIVRV